ncbi:MAG: hypothetical protein KatS3mg031_2590 [Chitinophagales bacterium]|nr:MAG: hypothetical protein KatS3mg031_2590 [Chitinophagales bacterium]
MDVDKPGAVAIAYDAANNVITSVNIPVGADASVQTIPVNAPGTRRFDLIYRDSGGFRLNLDCSTSQKRENSSDLTLETTNAQLQVRSLPNPFSSQANLQFSVTETVHARAELLSADGKIVQTLFNGIAAGGQQYDFNLYASDLTAGMYIFRVVTEKGDVRHTRLMLVK